MKTFQITFKSIVLIFLHCVLLKIVVFCVNILQLQVFFFQKKKKIPCRSRESFPVKVFLSHAVLIIGLPQEQYPHHMNSIKRTGIMSSAIFLGLQIACLILCTGDETIMQLFDSTPQWKELQSKANWSNQQSW